MKEFDPKRYGIDLTKDLLTPVFTFQATIPDCNHFPTDSKDGDIVFDCTTQQTYVYIHSEWIPLCSDVSDQIDATDPIVVDAKCEHCGGTYERKEDNLGIFFECPSCGNKKYVIK